MDVSYIAGTHICRSGGAYLKPGPGGHRGEFDGWDPVARAAQTRVGGEGKFPVWSGTVVTGGNLVFYGRMDGGLRRVKCQERRNCGSTKSESGHYQSAGKIPRADGHKYIARLKRCRACGSGAGPCQGQ